jgi:outer membrane protein assembly factor BamB
VRLGRTLALAGLLILAVLVAAIGVLALISSAPTHRLAAVPTATATASPTATPATPTAIPTFTPSPSLPGNDWPQYRFDTASTGVNPESLLTQANIRSMTQLWQTTKLPVYMSTPAVVGSVAYVTNANSLYAFDLHTGTQLWRFGGGPQPYGDISSSVGVDAAAGLAFYGSPDTRVYAVNIRTGHAAWATFLGDPKKGGHIWSSPLLLNGRVYIGLASTDDNPCVRGGVFALDEQTGAIIWTHYMIRAVLVGGGVWSSVEAVPAKHEIIATTGNPGPCPATGNPAPTVDQTDAFVAMDWDTGATLWQYTAFGSDGCDCDFGQGPVDFTYQGQEEVIGGNKNGFVYALRPPAGRTGTPTLLWSRQISVTGYYQQGGIYEPPTYYNGVVYIAGGPTPDGTCAQGSLNALRVTDGAVLWRICTSGQVASASALSSGMLFVAQLNTVAVYDISSGKTLWSASYQSQVWGGVALAHGRLLVALVSGTLNCYGIPGVSP